MGQTQYFSLAFFDFGDTLDSQINIQKEIDRFVIIDKQLYGLYNVFGNGVISGWTVKDGGYDDDEGISVSVDSGIGIIQYMASESSLPEYVYGLPSNSIVTIYATISGSSARNRLVSFFYSSLDLSDNNDVVKLATVSTGESSINYIDNTVRTLINFQDLIEDEINQHRHRGTPSKIDLQEEVKNQLSGARIADLDASKVTTGQFDVSRVPIIDHNDLENNGMMTHAALDSFVQTLSQSNRELLGEIASVNLLKTIVFLKYVNSSVDDYFVNELVMIPGVSPNSFIDFNNSTANINLTQNCISGIPAKTGTYTSVYWNNTYSFNTAYSQNNVTIANDEINLTRTGSVEDLVTNFSNDEVGFETETLIVSNDQSATVAIEDSNRLGRLGGGGTLKYFYRSNLAQARDWDGVYDELVIKVKTNEQIHNPVYMYVVNGSNTTSDGTSFGSIEDGNIEGAQKPSSPWILLEEDEYMSSFEEKTFDISSLSLDNVTQITIYTSDDFVFDIDDIYVRRTNLVAPSGVVRFRYQTEANVTFHSIFYTGETPDDTTMSVRVKTASSSDLLFRSSSSLPLISGSVFSLEGRAVEIEVAMTSNTERTVTPTLESLELRLLTEADYNGFVIDRDTEWSRGTLGNLTIQDGTDINHDELVLTTPINVDGRYFAKGSSVSEVNDSKIGVLGFSGSNMPISPKQAREWSATSSRGFNTISSAVRKYNKNYLIADMLNDRVLEVNSSGTLVKGFGSSYAIDTNFYPLTACYNSTTGVLSIVFTKVAEVVDITKIAFYIGSSKVSLTSGDTVLTNKKAEGRIVEISLSTSTSANLTGVTGDLSVNFESGAFSDTISINTGMTSEGNSIFSVLRGVSCFIGNFTFIDNIKHPVFVNETQDDTWIIANSSIFYNTVDSSKEKMVTVPDIIEINPSDLSDTDGMISSSDITFSEYSLGTIYEFEEGRFLVAGLTSSTSTITGTDGATLLSQYEEPIPDSVQFRAGAIDALSGYAGKIFLLDRLSNRVQVFYNSPDGLYPSDIDMYSDGSFLVSESSFAESSGRLIKLDSYGNILWNYGSGIFNIINDAKVLNNDNIIISV